jgi:HPt (histidine-containing phosphotransfer) domain-containing protein
MTTSMLLHGRYNCCRLLKGGHGVETYLAEDLEADGAPVVVKLLHIDMVAPAVLIRLEHEAGVLSRLEGSSFRPLLNYARDEEYLYFVQPYLPGQNLAERLTSGPVSIASTLIIAANLLAALRRAHNLGILHRDVKPANVIVRGTDPIEVADLIDFGLARTTSLDPALRDQAVGTARYLAPEQAGLIDSPVDERSDLYSLGVVLYECLAGRPPFEGPSVGEVLRQHLSMPVTSLGDAGVVAPRALEAVVLRLLGKEPGQRYQSASAALSDVEEIAADFARGVVDPPVVIGLHDARSILTALAMAEDRARCLEAGMDDYLPKPVRVEDLVASLNRWALADSPTRVEAVAATAGSVPGEVSETDHQQPDLDQEIIGGLRKLGGPSLLDELVSLFRDDVGRHLSELDRALEDRDPVALRQAAHAISGSSANMGAARLATTAVTIEHLALAGDLEGAQALTTDLASHCRRALDALAGEIGPTSLSLTTTSGSTHRAGRYGRC